MNLKRLIQTLLDTRASKDEVAEAKEMAVNNTAVSSFNSGETFVAPANGFVTFGTRTRSGGWANVTNGGLYMAFQSPSASDHGGVLPVKKGDSVSLGHGNYENFFVRFFELVGTATEGGN